MIHNIFIVTCFSFVLATVFIIDNHLADGVVYGKYFWYYFSLELIAIISAGGAIINTKKLQFGISDSFILLFILISFSSISNSSHAKITTGYLLFLLIIILYFYLRFIFQANEQSSYWLPACLVITGLIESIWGLRQLYGYEPSQHNLFRITGSFFNPGPYACYVAVIFPMALYYMVKYRICYHTKFHFRNFRIYTLWGIATLTAVSSVLVLPATMSRASWLAAIGGCGWVLLSFLIENKKVKAVITFNKKKCMLITSAIVLLTVAGGIGMYHLKKDSANGRMLIWKNTVELIKQHPMGVGIGNFSGSYGHVQAAYFEAGHGTDNEKRVAGNPEYAFNEYLQICAEQGIVVFLLFSGIIGYSLYIGIKQRKIAPTASLIALLITASASYPFSVLPFPIVLAFLLALINTGEKSLTIPKSASITFAFCSLLVVSLCLYNRYPIYNAYKKWNNIKMSYSFGNQQNAANEYRNIYPLLSDQIQFLFEYAQCLSKSEQYEESNEVLEKAVKISCDPMLYNVMGKNYQGLKQYTRAEQCFLKASHIVPNRIYPHYLMALMYAEVGETGKAKAAAQIVLSKEPKVPSTAVREMKNKMKGLLDAN